MTISNLIQRLLELEKESQAADVYVHTDDEGLGFLMIDSVRLDEDGDVILEALI
jgi:hypothetical protein